MTNLLYPMGDYLVCSVLYSEFLIQIEQLHTRAVMQLCLVWFNSGVRSKNHPYPRVRQLVFLVIQPGCQSRQRNSIFPSYHNCLKFSRCDHLANLLLTCFQVFRDLCHGEEINHPMDHCQSSRFLSHCNCHTSNGGWHGNYRD